MSEKICNSLDISCSVISLSKLSAEWDTIVTPSHFKTDNFLKNDVIIFCGGTKNISSNDTNKGLRCFKQFAMKTSNTNVIILDPPHLHDLQEILCIYKEVIIFSACSITHYEYEQKPFSETWLTFELLWYILDLQHYWKVNMCSFFN